MQRLGEHAQAARGQVVRKILSDTSTTAEPTEASAAICFAELGFDLEMTDSLEAPLWPSRLDYTTMPEFSERCAALRAACGTRPQPQQSASRHTRAAIC